MGWFICVVRSVNVTRHHYRRLLYCRCCHSLNLSVEWGCWVKTVAFIFESLGGFSMPASVSVLLPSLLFRGFPTTSPVRRCVGFPLHCSASFGPLASHPVVLCLMKNPSRYPSAYLLLPAGSVAERLPDTYNLRSCCSSEEVISTLCGVDHLGLYLHHHWAGKETKRARSSLLHKTQHP